MRPSRPPLDPPMLNTAVTKYDQHILNITSCNTLDHFNRWGSLSPKRKVEFWYKIDDLFENLDKKQIRLPPITHKIAKNKIS